MSDERELLRRTAEIAADYLDTLATRPIRPEDGYAEMHTAFDRPVPEGPTDAMEVIEELVAIAEPGLTAMGSGRYFGFVIGGSRSLGDGGRLARDGVGPEHGARRGHARNLGARSRLPAGGSSSCSGSLPLLVRIRHGLPDGSRHLPRGRAPGRVFPRRLRPHRARPCLGAPASGGRRREAPRHADARASPPRHRPEPGGRRPRRRARPDEGRAPTRRARAGTSRRSCAPRPGRSTPARSTISTASPTRSPSTDAWVHVDGAFGLWAAAHPRSHHLVAGHDRADSWATDGHKWLNVPYDCGIALCRHPADHAAAMEYAAPYLDVSEAEVARDPMGYSPEFSRRARSAPVWAAIRELGRAGVADLVERTCAHARALAAGLAKLPGCEIVNEVVLNQVLLRFGTDEETRARSSPRSSRRARRG